MSRGGIKAGEAAENPWVRNLLHLLFTLILGYVLLRAVLYVLDTARIGTEWLQLHPDGGFFVIILILIISMLLADIALSAVRRQYLREQKFSLAESAVSFILSRMSGREIGEVQADRFQQEIVVQKNVTSFADASRPPDIIPPGKIPEFLSPPLKPDAGAKIIPEKLTREKQEKSHDRPEPSLHKPPAMEEKPPTHEFKQEPASNILLSESVIVQANEGKRIIKAFESEHCVNVIDFRSKVTKKDVKITVELLMGPSKYSSPITDALVYEYDNILIDLLRDFIENAVIRFNVEKDWINRNSIQTIQFRQEINGNWVSAPVKKIGQDAKYMFLEASVSNFSVPCAVVGL